LSTGVIHKTCSFSIPFPLLSIPDLSAEEKKNFNEEKDEGCLKEMENPNIFRLISISNSCM